MLYKMRFLHRQTVFLLLFGFGLSASAQIGQNLDVRDFATFEGWVYETEKVRIISPDKALALQEGAYEYYTEQGDTLNAVNALLEKSLIFGHKGEYQAAYDYIWKAMILADKAKNETAKVNAYISLGRYLGYYKREKEAFSYFDTALHISKKLLAKGEAGADLMVKCYYPLVALNRELNNYGEAEMYLDSCYYYIDEANIDKECHIIFFEEALIKGNKGEYQKAAQELQGMKPCFEESAHGFFVFLETYTGDMYHKMMQHDRAIEYYRKALEISAKYKSHIDFTPTIYERLSTVYLEKGDYRASLTALRKEKELNLLFFDSRSANNRSLLEVKDEFKRVKAQEKEMLQKQKLAEAEQQKQIAFWKNTLLGVTIIFLILAGILFFNFIKNKHKAEKQLLRKKKELEMQQKNELLELKNKELATSTLKLIEKDEVLADLKSRLSKRKGDISAFDLNKIVRSISNSSTSNWDEFEKRFISVNKDFYNKLNSRYPKLSRGDQKLCALIKLNLSSKEMAKLLGISIESVHTNRYRLRKKLGLTREVSLTEFVARL